MSLSDIAKKAFIGGASVAVPMLQKTAFARQKEEILIKREERLAKLKTQKPAEGFTLGPKDTRFDEANKLIASSETPAFDNCCFALVTLGKLIPATFTASAKASLLISPTTL